MNEITYNPRIKFFIENKKEESEEEINEKIQNIIIKSHKNLYPKIKNYDKAIIFESFFNMMMEINDIPITKMKETLDEINKDSWLNKIIFELDIDNSVNYYQMENKFQTIITKLNTISNYFKDNKDEKNLDLIKYTKIILNFEQITFLHIKCLQSCFDIEDDFHVQHDKIMNKISTKEYEVISKLQNYIQYLQASDNIDKLIKNRINEELNNNLNEKNIGENAFWRLMQKFVNQCVENVKSSYDYTYLKKHKYSIFGYLGVIYEKEIKTILSKEISKEYYQNQKPKFILQINKIVNEVDEKFFLTNNLIDNASSKLDNKKNKINKINDLIKSYITLINNIYEWDNEKNSIYSDMFGNEYYTMNDLLKYNQDIIDTIEINKQKITEIFLRSQKRMKNFSLVLFVVIFIVVVILSNIYDE